MKQSIKNKKNTCIYFFKIKLPFFINEIIHKNKKMKVIDKFEIL